MKQVTPLSPNFQAAHPEVIIFGAGGHAKAVIDLLAALGTYRLAGLVDENFPAGARLLDIPVLGGREVLPSLVERGVRLAINAIGGIGNVDARLQVFDLLTAAGFQFPAIIHPSVVVEPSARVEDGVHILPLSYIGSAAVIGFGSLLNAGVIVSHDCTLGRVVNLSPGAMLAGGVQVGDHSQIGMGVTINVNLRIGARARVGNGATIKADVPDGGRVHAGETWPAPPPSA